jgi:hypothetical protein
MAINQALAVAEFSVSATPSASSECFFWSEIFDVKILLTGSLDPNPATIQVIAGDFAADQFVIDTEVDSS